MGTVADRHASDADGQMEFFGFRLRVKSPRLAALLTADDDAVCVVRTSDEVPAEPRAQALEAAAIWKSARREDSGAVVQLRRPAADH